MLLEVSFVFVFPRQRFDCLFEQLQQVGAGPFESVLQHSQDVKCLLIGNIPTGWLMVDGRTLSPRVKHTTALYVVFVGG